MAVVAAVLLFAGMWTVNAWFRHQRMVQAAGKVSVPEWHRKMIDLCGQMEGLDATQVVERFRAQQFSANIGYGGVRLDVCGQTRTFVKQVIVSPGPGTQNGPRVWMVRVFFDDAGRAFAATVWTVESFARMESIVEFCEPGSPSVRDHKGP